VRRVAIAAVMILLLHESAFAQSKSGPATVRSDAERKQDAEIDKAYQEAVKRSNLGVHPAKADPWQTVRPADGDNAKH